MGLSPFSMWKARYLHAPSEVLFPRPLWDVSALQQRNFPENPSASQISEAKNMCGNQPWSSCLRNANINISKGTNMVKDMVKLLQKKHTHTPVQHEDQNTHQRDRLYTPQPTDKHSNREGFAIGVAQGKEGCWPTMPESLGYLSLHSTNESQWSQMETESMKHASIHCHSPISLQHGMNEQLGLYCDHCAPGT